MKLYNPKYFAHYSFFPWSSGIFKCLNAVGHMLCHLFTLCLPTFSLVAFCIVFNKMFSFLVPPKPSLSLFYPSSVCLFYCHNLLLKSIFLFYPPPRQDNISSFVYIFPSLTLLSFIFSDPIIVTALPKAKLSILHTLDFFFIYLYNIIYF